MCGHTQCGAMQAILDPERIEKLSYVKRWLVGAARVREIIDTRYADLDATAKITAAVLENVLVSLENLREFRFIADRLAAGTLTINGSTGKIRLMRAKRWKWRTWSSRRYRRGDNPWL